MRLCKTRRQVSVPAGALLLLSSLAPGQGPPREGNQIRVEIVGLRSDTGQVICSLFSSEEDFPKKANKAVAGVRSVIANRHAACEFPGVFPGTYAISVFHDENANGKLDTNLVGIPREGVGASNDARGHFGPPKFADAAFPFPGGRFALMITMSYL